MMKQVRNGGMPAGMPPGMGMPALPKVNTPVNKKKKSKSGNPAKRAAEEREAAVRAAEAPAAPAAAADFELPDDVKKLLGG